MRIRRGSVVVLECDTHKVNIFVQRGWWWLEDDANVQVEAILGVVGNHRVGGGIISLCFIKLDVRGWWCNSRGDNTWGDFDEVCDVDLKLDQAWKV